MSKTATRVLICDDDEDVRALLQNILSSLNCEIVALCSDGKDGIRQFTTSQPDLVFMDIRMPGKDGMATLRDIIKLNAQAKVVMLSAMDDTAVAESSSHSGACGYIRKSLSMGELYEELSDTLKQLGFAT